MDHEKMWEELGAYAILLSGKQGRSILDAMSDIEKANSNDDVKTINKDFFVNQTVELPDDVPIYVRYDDEYFGFHFEYVDETHEDRNDPILNMPTDKPFIMVWFGD